MYPGGCGLVYDKREHSDLPGLAEEGEIEFWERKVSQLEDNTVNMSVFLQVSFLDKSIQTPTRIFFFFKSKRISLEKQSTREAKTVL